MRRAGLSQSSASRPTSEAVRPKLPALEKNILKYRALQMVLLLHEVETFRYFLLGTIRGTDRFRKLLRLGGAEQLPQGTKDPMKKALALMVEESILTEAESADIQKIIDLRNDIGHRVHEVVEDISQPEIQRLMRPDARYDYHALARFERHRKKVTDGLMRKHFVMQLDFRAHSFEQAEAAYKEELQRLDRRITRQLEERRARLQRSAA